MAGCMYWEFKSRSSGTDASVSFPRLHGGAVGGIPDDDDDEAPVCVASVEYVWQGRRQGTDDPFSSQNPV